MFQFLLYYWIISLPHPISSILKQLGFKILNTLLIQEAYKKHKFKGVLKFTRNLNSNDSNSFRILILIPLPIREIRISFSSKTVSTPLVSNFCNRPDTLYNCSSLLHFSVTSQNVTKLKNHPFAGFADKF